MQQYSLYLLSIRRVVGIHFHVSECNGVELLLCIGQRALLCRDLELRHRVT